VSYLAIFFNTAYGVDRVAVGGIVAFASLMGSALRPVGGYLSDRIGGVTLVRIVYVAFALCAFAIALAPPLPVCEVVVFLAVGLLGMGNGAVFQVVPQRFPNEIGIVTGIVGAAGGIGGFYLPNLLGILRAATGTFASGDGHVRERLHHLRCHRARRRGTRYGDGPRVERNVPHCGGA